MNWVFYMTNLESKVHAHDDGPEVQYITELVANSRMCAVDGFIMTSHQFTQTLSTGTHRVVYSKIKKRESGVHFNCCLIGTLHKHLVDR